MEQHLFDNDDDLFSSSYSQSSSTTNTPSDFDTFIEQTKEIIDSKNTNTTQFVIRTGIVTSLYEICNNFIFSNESSTKTIFDTLNRLTNNNFELQLYSDVLENSILKRFSIKQFLESILSDETISVVKNNSSNFKIDVDESFFFIYFGSMLKLMNHSIERNIQIYEKLCAQISKDPLKQIIERDYHFSDSFIFNPIQKIDSSFTAIKQSLGFNTY
jgi:hypothetical protein